MKNPRSVQKSTPYVKEANNLEMGLGLNVKIKQECDVFVSKGEFFKGQPVYYFSPKNHVIYNPKIPMCGPFLISKLHACGAIYILLNDNKYFTVNRKRCTTRTIWRPK